MGINAILDSIFWSKWINKFEDSDGKYITPGEEMVVHEARSISFDESNGKEDIARTVWSHVHKEIKYNLSKEWKPPAQTLVERVGDCEDMVFLMISIFPNVGIENPKMVIGSMERPDGRGGFHVWVEVDGIVMDPTGTPESIEDIEYSPRTKFGIQFNNEPRKN